MSNFFVNLKNELWSIVKTVFTRILESFSQLIQAFTNFNSTCSMKLLKWYCNVHCNGVLSLILVFIASFLASTHPCCFYLPSGSFATTGQPAWITCVTVYIYISIIMFVHFTIRQCWLYTLLLAAHPCHTKPKKLF